MIWRTIKWKTKEICKKVIPYVMDLFRFPAVILILIVALIIVSTMELLDKFIKQL